MDRLPFTSKVGASSFKFSFNGKTFQREAGMLVPYADMPPSFELEDESLSLKPRLYHPSIPLREGEFILKKDDPDAPDWNCAKISQVLTDRIKISYYTTITEPLESYREKSYALRTKRLND